MKEGDVVKIKNPGFPFQNDLRYTITEVKKNVVNCYENSNPRHIYKNIKKSLIELVNS